MTDDTVTEITDGDGRTVAVATGDYQPRRSADPMSREQVALQRGWQTLIQGLGVDVLIAVCLLMSTQILPAATSWDAVAASWQLWVLLIITTSLKSMVAWVLRKFVDSTGFEGTN